MLSTASRRNGIRSAEHYPGWKYQIENTMPKYIMWGSYCENAIEKRSPHRQAHLDGLGGQKEQGILITLGPTKDNTQVFGIYEADNQETVRQLVESDPYWQNGIWTEYQIKEWIQAF